MTATRFTQISETYVPGDHAEVYVASAEVGPGHVITRTHSWMDRFGPVPGSHHVEYVCTCGATTLGTHGRPHGSDLDGMHHFADAAEREAFEQAEAEHLARILRTLER